MTDRLQLHITGPYRSGTGYVSLLLGNHPDLAVGHHTTNLFRYWDGECVDWLGVADNIARWSLDFDRGHDYELGSWPGDAPAWDIIMRALFDSPRWAEKQQLAWRHIPTFLDWFPETGKALLIIRDPRSVLASFREYTYHPEPAYLGAAFNCLDAMHWALDLQGNPRVRYVRYEDVARQPEVYTESLIWWLGLDWPGEDVMLDTSTWKDTPGGPVSTRSAFEPVGELDVQKAIERWKGNLDDEELLFVETVCSAEMRRLGYVPVTGCDMDPGRMMEMCEGDKVAGWCREWLRTGEGVQAFPSDPRDPSSWAENQKEEVA